jgi:hypothetical protein
MNAILFIIITIMYAVKSYSARYKSFIKFIHILFHFRKLKSNILVIKRQREGTGSESFSGDGGCKLGHCQNAQT